MMVLKFMLPFAALILAPLSSQAVKWERIWEQSGIAIIYVDRTSAAGPSDLRSITTRTVYNGALPEGYIAERIRTEEFDCAGGRSRVRRVTILANDGRPSQTVDWAAGESKWLSNEPDTLGATKSEIACAPSGDHASKQAS